MLAAQLERFVQLTVWQLTGMTPTDLWLNHTMCNTYPLPTKHMREQCRLFNVITKVVYMACGLNLLYTCAVVCLIAYTEVLARAACSEN